METIAAKVPKDMAEEIEEYRAEHDLNTSQAMRRLVEDGIDAQEPDRTIPASYVLLLTGAVLFTAEYVTATGHAGEMGIAMIALAFLIESERIQQHVQTLRAWYTERTGNSDSNTTA